MTADFTADILIRPVPQAIAQAKTLLTQGIEFAKLQEFERAIAHFTQSIHLTLTLLKPNPEHSGDPTQTRSLNVAGVNVAEMSVAEVTTVEVTATRGFYHRGCAFSRIERYDRALAAFPHLVRQPPTSATIPATWLISYLTDIYIHRGNAHRRLGEYPQALADLNQAIKRSNGSAQSYSGRGLLHLDTSDFEQAIEDFSAAIQQHPTFAQAYLWRGFAYLRGQKPQQAIADLDHAIAAIPTCAEAYNHRGIAHLHLNNLTKAQSDFSQAIRLNPTFAEVYNNRGNLHQLLGDHSSATIDYERANALTHGLTQSNNHPTAAFYRHQAQINATAGRIDAAIADYSSALSITPTAYALYQRGKLYVQIGENEKALADFDRALVRSPDYAEIYCDRSHLHFQAHNLPSTLADTNKAIELFPLSYALKETFITRCLTHFSLSNKQQALADFEQLVTLIEGHHNNHHSLK